MSKETILVGPLSAVNPTIENSNVGYLVTLINDQTMIDTPPSISPNKHLRLAMNDISEPQPGMVIPGDDHVSELLDFVTAWDQQAPMLIHCWAGISRSTAAAFITLCALNPKVGERHIAQTLRAASPTATPNRRLVTLADALLDREGRMKSAIDEIGRGQTTMEGQLFKLPARLAA
ncbi:MAG: tyrosine protein phosphatase [Pseudomonadota bacterium]